LIKTLIHRLYFCTFTGSKILTIDLSKTSAILKAKGNLGSYFSNSIEITVCRLTTNKAAMPIDISSCLNQLNLQQNHWLKQLENVEQHYCHVIEPIELIKEKPNSSKSGNSIHSSPQWTYR